MTDQLGELDLRSGAVLAPTIGLDYDLIRESIQGEYFQLLEVLAKQNNNPDWILQAVNARNPYFSDLEHQLTSIRLLKKLYAEDRFPGKIIVNCKYFSGVIDAWLNRYDLRYRVELEHRKTSLVTFARAALSPLRFILTTIVETLLAKCLRAGEQITQKPGRLILINVFVSPGPVFGDRYFPSLDAELYDCGKKYIYVPEFVDFSLRKKWAIYQGHYNNENFPWVSKARYRRISTIWRLIKHWIYVLRFKSQGTVFDEVSVDGLLRAALVSNKGFASAARGLMNICFARDFAGYGIEVSHSISWWENQPPDQGWQYGFRRYFADGEHIGYKGMHGAYPALEPLAAEYTQGYLPTRVSVMGEAFIGLCRSRCHNLEVDIGPAFRYRWLRERYSCNSPAASKQVVLMVVPLNVEAATYMMSTVLSVVSEMNGTNGWKYIFRFHPLMKLDRLNINVPDEQNITISTSSIREDMGLASHMITAGNTTAGIEGLAAGLRVAFISRPGYRHEVPKLEVLTQKECQILTSDLEVQAWLATRQRVDTKRTELLRKLLFGASSPNDVQTWLQQV